METSSHIGHFQQLRRFPALSQFALHRPQTLV
jgi:hypothetical protein